MKIKIKDVDGSLRDAVPVRAIPFITGSSWSPLITAGQLATRTDYEGYNLRAYLSPANQILAKEWDPIVAEQSKIEEDAPSSMDRLKRAITALPPDCFVWADDLDYVWGEYQRDIDGGTRHGDAYLTYEPMISPDLKALVLQGFKQENAHPVELDPRNKTSMLRIIAALAKNANLPAKGFSASVAHQLQQLGFEGPGEATIKKIITEARALEPDEKPQ